MSDVIAAANGTDQRLDLILDELRALRAVLAPAARPEPRDGETVELREPRPLPSDPPMTAPRDGGTPKRRKG